MKPIIYTTGAHLQPMKIRNNDGTECWIWAVLEFVDDSFKDGEAFNPQETANSLECLLTE
jgi:hypothetical protein